MPKASDLWIGSTALRVATTFGIEDMKVNQMEINNKTIKPGRNEHGTPHLPFVPILVSLLPGVFIHWQSKYSVLLPIGENCNLK